MIPILPENYTYVLQDAETQGKLVLVDCWSDWCKACKAMEHVLDTVQNNLREYVTMYSLNIESISYEGLPNKLFVTSLPTYILFDKGEEVSRVSGAMTAQDMEHWIRDFV